MAKMASLHAEQTTITEPTTEPELCEYCGDTVDDCIDAGECNYGEVGVNEDNCPFCRFECNCDAKYEDYKDQEASDYFDSIQ